MYANKKCSPAGGAVEEAPGLNGQITELLFARGAFEDKPVTEQQLADHFGMSRTPIRDALKEVEREGIIERVQGKGIYLRRLSVSEVAEVYDVRAVLEGFAGRIATGRAQPHDLDQLQALAQDVARARADRALARSDQMEITFHGKIVSLAHNTTLMRITDGLSIIARSFRMSHTPGLRDELRPTPYTHEAIVEKMRERDAEGCAALLQRHVEHAKQVLVEQILGVSLNHFPEQDTGEAT